ncbi:DUF2505 domain-containing protein [Nocardioides sp. KR10-350]|uniref:DUF2505 domain-containing protein n=1 Tax=Nocardioides cheoyonin TaxID=3156615 RepID=UPI0032B3712F
MTTTLTVEHTYDASVRRVAEMLADPTFRERVCDAQGASRRSVSIGGTPLQVTIERVQPTAGVPAVASRFVSGEVVVHHHEVWSSETAAVVEITPAGGLATIRGNTTLVENAGRTTQTVHLSIKVSIPLVGGRIEALVQDLMRKAYRSEHEVGVAYLAEQGA